MYKASESCETLFREFCLQFGKCQTHAQVYLHILLKHTHTHIYLYIYVKPMCYCVCVGGRKHLTLTWACTFSPKSGLTLPHAPLARLLCVCVCVVFFMANLICKQRAVTVVWCAGLCGRGQGSHLAALSPSLSLSLQLNFICITLTCVKLN